ncbi:MAG TPA: bifunctional nuclease family protein [Bacteroidia bacterium]|nr:bifunctional nuclease family protein [Bacteroidia bacterium]
MEKIRLEIAGLSYSQTQSGAYALVLAEEAGKRKLPIIIGAFEAQAIAVELENMTPTRPLTHDLFKNFSLAFDITLAEVVIYSLKEGVFFAKLICTSGEREEEIDARTSDAIALAVRFNCPIYTYDWIIAQAGVSTDEESPLSLEGQSSGDDSELEKVKEPRKDNRDIHSLSDEELKENLSKAIDDEAYELASKIRDELNKRKKS